MFWTVHAGQDPVKFIKKFGGRCVLMHVKDLRKGAATGKLSGGEDMTNDVVLGTGQIDMPAVLRAAQAAGIKHYMIEDESPTPSVAALDGSRCNLFQRDGPFGGICIRMERDAIDPRLCICGVK